MLTAGFGTSATSRHGRNLFAMGAKPTWNYLGSVPLLAGTGTIRARPNTKPVRIPSVRNSRQCDGSYSGFEIATPSRIMIADLRQHFELRWLFKESEETVL
jgi:hypothetical protein